MKNNFEDLTDDELGIELINSLDYMGREILSAYNRIPTTEIVDEEMMHGFLKQISKVFKIFIHFLIVKFHFNFRPGIAKWF